MLQRTNIFLNLRNSVNLRYFKLRFFGLTYHLYFKISKVHGIVQWPPFNDHLDGHELWPLLKKRILKKISLAPKPLQKHVCILAINSLVIFRKFWPTVKWEKWGIFNGKLPRKIRKWFYLSPSIGPINITQGPKHNS